MVDPLARSGAPHTAEAARPVQILIVDDNPVDRLLYRQMLKDLNGTYAVEEVDSAEAAAVRLEQSPAPDCVLLDHCLPGMTGLDLLHGYASATGLPAPVVMLTALADEVFTFRAMQAGASATLSKEGVTALALRAAVNTAIQLELPHKQEVLAAEYEYASVAYTGARQVPSTAELAQFAIAQELYRFVRAFRRAETSLVPRAMSPRSL